jgi:hypothetical protein
MWPYRPQSLGAATVLAVLGSRAIPGDTGGFG